MTNRFYFFLKANSKLFKVYFLYLTIVTSVQILISYYLDIIVNKINSYNLIYHIFTFWGLSWDGIRYYNIYKYGYVYPDYAFFPGIPLIYNFLSFFLADIFILRINIILLLFLIFSLNRFIKELGISKEVQLKTLILFLCYPYSIFFLMGYSESLYLIISIWFLIFLNHKKYLQSSLVGFFLGFFKISVVCLPIIYLYKLYQDKILDLSLKLKNILGWSRLFLYSIISCLGVFLYFLYLQIYHGDFMKFFISQVEWGRMDYREFLNLSNLNYGIYFNFIFEIIVLSILIYLFIKNFNKIKPEYYLFSLFHIMIPLATGTVLSMTRFSLYAFPLLLIFFADISKKSKNFYSIFLGIMILFYILNIYFLCKGVFIG